MHDPEELQIWCVMPSRLTCTIFAWCLRILSLKLQVELRQLSEGISDGPAPTQLQESFGHVRSISFAERNGAAGNIALHDNIKIVAAAARSHFTLAGVSSL